MGKYIKRPRLKNKTLSSGHVWGCLGHKGRNGKVPGVRGTLATNPVGQKKQMRQGFSGAAYKRGTKGIQKAKKKKEKGYGIGTGGKRGGNNRKPK